MDNSINLWIKNNIWLPSLILSLIVFWNIYPWIKEYFSPKIRKGRHEKREENARLAKKEQERRQQEVLEQHQKINKQELEKQRQKQNEREQNYKTWRTGLWKMPKYETWRQQIFSKDGKRCVRCGSTQNLEIHHEKSLRSIYEEGGFERIMISNGLETALDKTIGYNELWNPNNGSVLCHKCHERQPSSQNFLLNNK